MNRQNYKWVFATVVLAAAIVVFIYPYNVGSALSHKQSDWGMFGDYIGGVLGTVLAGVTIYLLLKTYVTQRAQLKIQEKDSNIGYIDLQYNQIIKDIDDLSLRDKKGSDALYAWDISDKEKPENNIFNTLNFIIHTFNTHIETIRSNKSIDKETKEHFYNRAYLMFHSKIIWPAKIVYRDPALSGHTDNLKDNFGNLIGETYAYLVPQNKLAIPDDPIMLALYQNELIRQRPA